MKKKLEEIDSLLYSIKTDIEEKDTDVKTIDMIDNCFRLIEEIRSGQIEPPVKPDFAELTENIESIVLLLGKVQIKLMELLKPEDHNNVSDFIHQAREYLINIE